jgi:CheY-like chemotaxis protein
VEDEAMAGEAVSREHVGQEEEASARILIVEDEPTVAKLVRRMVERSGFEASLAMNGQEALALLARERADLVLMDVAMPLLDGIETTRAIRADPRTAHLPVVMVTGKAFPKDLAAMREAGASEIVTKPFRLREIAECLQRHLRRQAPSQV